MWTEEDIVQAISSLVLIACLPFLYIYVRKTTKYILYKYWPRDVLLTYKDGENITEGYLIKRALFKKTTYIKLSKKELEAIGAIHEG